MNRLILPIIVIVLLSACSENISGYMVEGSLRGNLADSTRIFLKKTNESNQLIDLDTAYLNAGKFVFEGAKMAPEMHYLFIDGTRGNVPVVLDEGVVQVSAHSDSLMVADVQGTFQNEEFKAFRETARDIQERVRSMSQDMQLAVSVNDSANMQSLREEYAEIQEEARNFEVTFIKEHPNALITVLLLEKINLSKTLSDQEIKALYDNISPEMKQTSVGKKIGEKIENGARTAIGQKAPNFSAPTPTGEELSLNQVLGKVTLVDFWAGWCRPCRVENPNIVRIYDKYKDKGLSIIGVSLDRKAEQWKKAIEDDGLSWHQVSNVRYFDEIARLYNVDAIPASFILDENGIIVAKNLRGEALEAQIAALLP